MICKHCAAAADQGALVMHDLCKGKTHCDCHHKPVGYQGDPMPVVVPKGTTCGYCGRPVRFNKDGKVRKHKAGDWRTCPGSGI